MTGEVFVDVIMKGGDKEVHVILSDHHSHIETIEINGTVIYTDDSRNEAVNSRGMVRNLTFRKIIELAESAEVQDIEFLLEGVSMNRSAASQGLKKKSGFRLGLA